MNPESNGDPQVTGRGTDAEDTLPFGEERVPLRALGISLLALGVAAFAGFLGPQAAGEFTNLVWLLALIPVFLLSYYKGWQGAMLAALLAMVALTLTEVVLEQLLAQSIEWRTFGFATVILIAVTLGSGLVSEVLHRHHHLALRMAYEDPLTGLANRRMIERDGENALARARREDDQVAVLFLDVIRFKRINDQLGFVAGDEALTLIGERIRNTLREADTVARVGGDEFAVLLPAIGSREELEIVADRIKATLWKPLKVAGETLHLGVRAGHALFPEDGSDFDTLLSEAAPGKTEATARARGLGLPEDDDDLAMEAQLVQALNSDSQLQVHYQPVARLEDEAVVGAEALLRWEHPERGMLSAAEFVPAAERMGIIQELELMLIRQVVEQASMWTRRDLPLWISANLSLTSLEGDRSRELLAQLTREHDLPEGRLIVEVTERLMARNPNAVQRVLGELRAEGLRVALDDFGTGQSSLAYLEQFPLDLIKVDRMFVAGLTRRGRKQRLVEGILGLARGLGLEVVAEGVEKQQQREWLKTAHCSLYQGHLLAPARSATELGRMLKTGRLNAVGSAHSSAETGEVTKS